MLGGAASLTVSIMPESADFSRIGDRVDFLVTIRNGGNLTLAQLTPERDDNATIICSSTLPISFLPPSSEETCTLTYNISDVQLSAGKISVSIGVLAILPDGTSLRFTADAAEIEIRAAVISGHVFTDVNGNGVFDRETDVAHAGYAVELFDRTVSGSTSVPKERGSASHRPSIEGVTEGPIGKLISSVSTDADGYYEFSGLNPQLVYSLVFRDSDGAVVGGIPYIEVTPGQNRTDQDMSIDPFGVIYDSSTGMPLAGARVTVTDPLGQLLPSICFLDAFQQNQTTDASGEYRINILPGADALCPLAEAEYRISVMGPAGFLPAPSAQHKPLAGPVDLTNCPFDVAPGGACQLSVIPRPPSGPAGLPYILSFRLQPGDPAVIYNHIPLDPFSSTTSISIAIQAHKPTLKRGERIGYSIRIRNNSEADAGSVRVVDRLPGGFLYVDGTARVDGLPFSPAVSAGRLDFGLQSLGPNSSVAVTLSLQPQASVGPGEYVNRAEVTDLSGRLLAPVAKAVVELLAEPVFDCAEVIGKVFNDANGNGYQDPGEMGLPAIRIASVRGTLIRTDRHGRFSVPCADLPGHDTGSNFILKLDERTLPVGYRMTTENPRVVRLTQGKMTEINFGVVAVNELLLSIDDDGLMVDGIELDGTLEEHIDRLLDVPLVRFSRISIIDGTSGARNDGEFRIEEIQAVLRERWRRLGSPYDLVIDVQRGTR